MMSVDHGIVLGCPRSGTTYLTDVLNGHPEFECVKGTLLPVAVPHVVHRDLDPEVYDALATGFERAIDAYLHSGRYHSRTAALQKWLQAPTGLSDLWDALRGERDLPECVVYKEPFLSFAPEFVLDAMPDARIVHIVRDGRDCAHSLRSTYDVLTDDRLRNLKASEARLGRKRDDRYVPWWVDEGRGSDFLSATPYGRAIWMWKEMVRRCHATFSQPGSRGADQSLVVHYEDLVRDPRQVGADLLDHFDKRPTSTVRHHLENAHDQSIGNYKERPLPEIREAERIAGDELDLYGYGQTTSDPASARLEPLDLQ